MNNEKLRFAIFGNEFQAKKSQAIQKIIAILQQHEAEIIMDAPLYKFVTEGQHMDVKVDEVFEGNDFTADFAISMGGDGTLLKTAARVFAKDTPTTGMSLANTLAAQDGGEGVCQGHSRSGREHRQTGLSCQREPLGDRARHNSDIRG